MPTIKFKDLRGEICVSNFLGINSTDNEGKRSFIETNTVMFRVEKDFRYIDYCPFVHRVLVQVGESIDAPIEFETIWEN